MRIWLKLGIIFLSIPIACAGESKATDSLNLPQVIVKVLEKSPLIKANDYEARAAAARIRKARLTKPLNVKIEMENFAGSNRYNGFDSVETTLSLAKILESGSKPALRGKVAEQEAHFLQNELDAKRLDLLSEAGRRFIHVAVDQERLRIAARKLELIERTAKIVDQRVRLGRSPSAERRRVAIEYARAEIEHEHAEHELLTSRLKLSTMWGNTTANNFNVKAPLFELQEVASFKHLETLLERNPDLVKYATRQRLAQARTNLSRSRYRPDISLSAGVRYLSDTDDGAFVFSASIPLGAKQQALPDFEASELMNEREPYIYEQRRLVLYATLFEIYQELSHAQYAVTSLHQRIIPQAERVFSDYEKGFKAGRYSLLELNEVQRSLLDARLEVVIAAEKYHRNRIEIERLTGAEMNTGVKQ